jgi:hypothetical protein
MINVLKRTIGILLLILTFMVISIFIFIPTFITSGIAKANEKSYDALDKFNKVLHNLID